MKNANLESTERQTIAKSATVHPLAHLDEGATPYTATTRRVRLDPLDTVNVIPGSGDRTTINAWLRKTDQDGIDIGNIPVSTFQREEIEALLVAESDEVVTRSSSIIATVRRRLNI